MSSNKKKEALGKGIRALLENIDTDYSQEEKMQKYQEASAGASQVSGIPIDQVEVNPFQPRNDFSEERLQELANSIKVHGVIQPISVRKLNNSKYQLIAGERRIRAAKMAGLTEVPAYIRLANDQEMLEIALIENIQREDLNAIEVSINYKRLMEECELTQEQLADRMGKNRTTVTNYLRLLKLPPEIQKAIKDKQITMGHARALINVQNVDLQLDIFHEIISKNLSVRKTEALVRSGMQPKKANQKQEEQLPYAYQKVQDRIASALSTKVNIKHQNTGKGQIVIHYYSDDDLNRILDSLDDEA